MIKVYKENEHIASMLPLKGQFLFSYEIAKKEIVKTAKIDGDLNMEKGFLYVLAINKKNAAKKFLKILTRQYQ